MFFRVGDGSAASAMATIALIATLGVHIADVIGDAIIAGFTMQALG